MTGWSGFWRTFVNLRFATSLAVFFAIWVGTVAISHGLGLNIWFTVLVGIIGGWFLGEFQTRLQK